MPTRFHAVSIDANDVELVARFWCNAAGFNLNGNGMPYFAELLHADKAIPRFLVIKVPETKSVKNRVHIEFAVDDVDEERERLEAQGASFETDREWGSTRWIVMRDPEGNEFCLVEAATHE